LPLGNGNDKAIPKHQLSISKLLPLASANGSQSSNKETQANKPESLPSADRPQYRCLKATAMRKQSQTSSEHIQIIAVG